MSDLRACPFCGGELQIYVYHAVGTDDLSEITCDKCHYFRLIVRGSVLQLYARPGDTFTGPDGEQLVAVPVEPTEAMAEAWAKVAIQRIKARLQDDDDAPGVIEGAKASYKAMIAAVKVGDDD